MNWNRNRTSRKNKKKNVNISSRYVLPHQIMRKPKAAVNVSAGFAWYRQDCFIYLNKHT